MPRRHAPSGSTRRSRAILAAVVAAAALAAGPARAQTTRYLAPDSGTPLGVDGLTNLPAGSWVAAGRALLRPDPPATATASSMNAGRVETAGVWKPMGRAYGPVYGAVTDLAPDSTATLFAYTSNPNDDTDCGTSAVDLVRAQLLDHDPAGPPGSDVVVASRELAGQGYWTVARYDVAFQHAAYTIQPGHRLVLALDYQAAMADWYCSASGATYLGSTTYPASITVTETPRCTPSATLAVPAGQSAAGLSLAPATLLAATNVASPRIRLGAPQSDGFLSYATTKWTKTDLGGRATVAPFAAGGTLVVTGAGNGAGGASDELTLVTQPVAFAGDFVVDVQVRGLSTYDGLQQAGLVVRQDLTAGAANAAILLTGTAGASFQARPTAGATTAVTRLAGRTAPQWVRLVRAGSALAGWVSADGEAWTQVGSAQVALTGTIQLGLAVASHEPPKPTSGGRPAPIAVVAQFSRFIATEGVQGVATAWSDPALPVSSASWSRGDWWLFARGRDAACGTPLEAAGSFAFSRGTTILGDFLAAEVASTPQVCPAAPAWVDVDRFTLRTSDFTDVVPSLKLTVANPGAVQAIRVVSDDGAVIHGQLQAPGASPALTLSTPISVGTTAAQYRIQFLPVAHAALAAGAYAVRARVAELGSTNTVTGADASSATATVDRAAPAAPTWSAPVLAENEVGPRWTNPAADFGGVVVLRGAQDAAVQTTALVAGTSYATGGTIGADAIAYVGTAQALTERLEGGSAWAYRIFAVDACGNPSAGAAGGPWTPPASAAATTVGAITATPGLCALVDLAATYAKDGDRNNGVTFQRRPAAGGAWQATTRCEPARVWEKWSCTDASPVEGGTWVWRAVFTDPGGFVPAGATAVETAPVTVARCPPGAGTLTVSALAAPPDVSAPPGSMAVPVAAFTLTVGNSTVDLEAIAIHNVATPAAPPADLALRLYEDVGGAPGAWDAADRLVASGTWSAPRDAWVLSRFVLKDGPHRMLLTADVRWGADAAAARRLRPGFATADVTVGERATLVGGAAVLGATVTIQGAPQGAPSGDPTPGGTKPMVSILNPGQQAKLSPDALGRVRVQVRVHDPGGAGIASVALSRQGGADGTFTEPLARSARYASSARGATWEGAVVLAPGVQALQARAVNGAGEAALSAPVFVTVGAAGAGDGNLLVRDRSSQLCTDCHALQTHSSEAVADPVTGRARHGAWALTCTDCHQPHGTSNAQLLREQLAPPPYAGYQPSAPAAFHDRSTGDGAGGRPSFVSSAGAKGPCQACHTRTASEDGTPRWRRDGSGADHYAGRDSAPCSACHSHQRGFAARESAGGEACGTCHRGKVQAMQPGASRSAHRLGPAAPATDGGGTWGSPLAGTGAPEAARSCVNTCHLDHAHGVPGGSAADAGNLYADGTSPATRAVARDAAGNPVAGGGGAGVLAADHVAGATQGCMACHRYPVDAERPAIDLAAYDGSAHGTTTAGGATWEYVLHDDARGAAGGTVSRFARNCTKCHAGGAEEAKTPRWTKQVQGVHFSDNPSLLGGNPSPGGVAAANPCYACHGGGATGADWSNGRNVAAQIARATKPGQSGHPSDAVADGQHDTAAEAAMSYGDAFPGSSRHAACVDCHDPHRARAGSRPARSSVAGPAIQGAPAARLATYPAPFTAPAAAAYWTTGKIQAGTDLEASLCFRCHSAFAWGSGTPPVSPSLAQPYTDQAKEFNPRNVSFHPVLADASTTYSRIDVRNLTRSDGAVDTAGRWNRAGRNRMTCTDCHGASDAPAAHGPHGSAVKFVLKGPNTRWDRNMTLGDRSGAFCFNCHDPAFAYTNTDVHNDLEDHAYIPCQGCHAAVPHGGARPGMLVDTYGGPQGQGIAGWDDSPAYNAFVGADGSPQYWFKIVEVPAPGGRWSYANCGCWGDAHGE